MKFTWEWGFGYVQSFPVMGLVEGREELLILLLVHEQYSELRPLPLIPSEPCFWVSHSSWSPAQGEASYQQQQSCCPADLFQSLPEMVNLCQARGFVSSEAKALSWDIRNSRVWLADAVCLNCR